MSNILREYLISLGFGVDQAEFSQFQSALDHMDSFVGLSTESMAGSFATLFLGANAGIVTMAAGLIGLVDHVANADQEFRLFAMHNYLNADSAKAFKISLDSLGVSLSDIYRDPELYGRFTKLLEDQGQLQKGLPGDFEKEMREARDLRFEFSRLHVEAQYGLMGLADSIFKGFGGEDFLGKFQHFNDWLIQNLPRLTSELSNDLNPLLRDTVELGSEVGHIFGDAADVFIKLTGAITGDSSLKGGEASFHNLALATEKWADALIYVVQLLDDAADGAINLFSLDPSNIGDSFKKLWSDARREGRFNEAEGEARGSESEYERLHQYRLSLPGGAALQKQALSIIGDINGPTQQAVIKAAHDAGVPESIALSIAYQESRFNQSAVSPKGALGVMQLMPDTAKGLGVNPNDEEQNIDGGMRYLRQLYDKFGDWTKAVQAYNEGPGNVLKGVFPKETQDYVPQVMGRAAGINDARQRYDMGARSAVQPSSFSSSDNSTTHVDVGGIHINQPGASHEQVKQAVVEGVREGLGRQNAQDHFEFAGSFA